MKTDVPDLKPTDPTPIGEEERDLRIGGDGAQHGSGGDIGIAEVPLSDGPPMGRPPPGPVGN